MYTLGHGFIPPASHAGGLRFHGMSPILSQLYHDGHLDEARSVTQKEILKLPASCQVEGTLPARIAFIMNIDEALRCKETGEKKVTCSV